MYDKLLQQWTLAQDLADHAILAGDRPATITRLMSKAAKLAVQCLETGKKEGVL